MIPTELIERALALCGKTIEDITQDVYHDFSWDTNFSMEKFCYYLISESFTDKYMEINKQNLNPEMDFVYAIRSYQKGNPDPLIKLLKKI